MPRVELRFDRLDVGEHETTRLYSLLDAGEREQAARYRFAIHRRRFIVRRGRLREWLGGKLDTPPRAIVMESNSFGKPVVPGWGGHFSASHSGERMLLASAQVELGCDLEAVKPDFDWRPLAQRLFAPGERAALAGLDDAIGGEAFFRCWARKEAFVKALGKGLSWPLESFEVSLGDDPAILSGGDSWAIAAVDLPGFACAIVAQDDGRPLAVFASEPEAAAV